VTLDGTIEVELDRELSRLCRELEQDNVRHYSLIIYQCIVNLNNMELSSIEHEKHILIIEMIIFNHEGRLKSISIFDSRFQD